MKPYLDAVIVVEGKEDETLIKTFFECVIFKTNGYDIKDEDIKFLQLIEEKQRIILLLDPDKAGRDISKRIKDKLHNYEEIVVDIDKCNRGIKNGVAEYDIESLKETLSKYVGNKPRDTITKSELFDLGLLGDESKRKFVSEKLNLGSYKTNEFLKRINLLKVTFNQLKELLLEYGNQ